MTREEELRVTIERNERWWADHGQFVRQTSVQRSREDNYRRLYDTGRSLWSEALGREVTLSMDYGQREKLGDRMAADWARRNRLHRPSHPPKCRKLVGGTVAYVGGKYARIGDAHDAPLPTDDADSASVLRRYEREKAERDFLEHAEAETGMQMSEFEYQKKKRETVLLRSMTEEIAQRLKAAGVEPYRDDEYKLSVFWIHSGTVEELPSYRRICILPWMAAMTRADKVAALEYFLQNNPTARFWTFTTGDRCTVEEIPQRLDWLYEKLRELNKILTARWGVQIVFRSTEFGTLEKDKAAAAPKKTVSEVEMRDLLEAMDKAAGGEIQRDHAGRPSYHPHAHCVVLPRWGYIGPKAWGQMIDFVGRFWSRGGRRVHWDAGKKIRSAKEACKYVTKPGDLLKLSGDELRAFYEATAHRRLVRPMGVLAGEIRARRESGRILRRRRMADGKFGWAEELNPNRLNFETEAEKAAMRNLQDAYAMTEECERLAAIEPPSVPGGFDGGTVAARGFAGEVTRVMARIGPAAGPTPYKEPRVLVMSNTRPDVSKIRNHPLVYRLWAQTVEAWEAGRALGAYSVHTGTLTGVSDSRAPDVYQPDLVPVAAYGPPEPALSR